MHHIHTQGDPFERGIQQAQSCDEHARKWLEQQIDRFFVRHLGTPANDTDLAKRIEWLEQLLPSVAAECYGIAKGLAVDPREYFGVVFALADPKCTTIGVQDTAQGAAIAKTDDVSAEEVGLNILESCTPNSGYSHLHFHFAGTTWTTAGLNAAGLAIAMTGVPGPMTNNVGVPALFPLRAVLAECANVAEAAELLRKVPINRYGISVMLADNQGTCISLECNAAGVFLVPLSAQGWFVHTNHLLANECQSLEVALPPGIKHNSIGRLNHIRSVLKTVRPTECELYRVISQSDSGGAPFQTGQEGFFTDYATVIVPRSRHLTYWTSNRTPRVSVVHVDDVRTPSTTS